MDELDLRKAGLRVGTVVRKGLSVEAGMAELIDWCAAHRPHKDWARAGKIAWNADVKRLRRWLAGVVANHPPGADIDGLFFGLFNPVYEEDPVADVYVCGNPYQADDEWASDPRWFPDGRYAGSSALARIYQIAYRDQARGLGNDMEYPLVLGYAALALSELCATLAEPLLGAAKKRVIAVGYDSGDMLVLGHVGPRGFVGKPRWA